jgi:hypothetical protein
MVAVLTPALLRSAQLLLDQLSKLIVLQLCLPVELSSAQPGPAQLAMIWVPRHILGVLGRARHATICRALAWTRFGVKM